MIIVKKYTIQEVVHLSEDMSVVVELVKNSTYPLGHDIEMSICRSDRTPGYLIQIRAGVIDCTLLRGTVEHVLGVPFRDDDNIVEEVIETVRRLVVEDVTIPGARLAMLDSPEVVA